MAPAGRTGHQPAPDDAELTGPADERPGPSLTIYTAPACGACTVTKSAAKKAGIPFEVIDISADLQLLDELRARGHQALPVVVSDDGQEWSGLDLDRIKALGIG